MSAEPFARAIDGGVEVDVLVVPRASRTRFFGVSDARLKVQLSAPPVDGEANRALIELFSDALGLRKQAISLRSGDKGKRKTLVLLGASLAAVLALGAPAK
ncbi:MAG: DUF167 domain-containing protein [Myxococcota bacterium]